LLNIQSLLLLICTIPYILGEWLLSVFYVWTYHLGQKIYVWAKNNKFYLLMKIKLKVKSKRNIMMYNEIRKIKCEYFRSSLVWQYSCTFVQVSLIIEACRYTILECMFVTHNFRYTMQCFDALVWWRDRDRVVSLFNTLNTINP
jgi:hypothetical protein